MVRAFIVLTLAVTFYFALEAQAEECDSPRHFKGCNIVGQQCHCDQVTACENPWQFKNSKKCRRALFGDPCEENPCMNKGICVQHKDGHAECKCAGTGYHGELCELACDATETRKRLNLLPEACIIP
ncbi:cysteine-rich motor neuron 1 protein-like [Diadema setosum]|uniref:cysteine-rich motor neuron 1 protein-like n=1 Tax=Diadema setosum TaxID=31175 RepID=UPI003B3BE162